MNESQQEQKAKEKQQRKPKGNKKGNWKSVSYKCKQNKKFGQYLNQNGKLGKNLRDKRGGVTN